MATKKTVRKKIAAAPAVMFTDVQLLAANLEPRFPDKQGKFEDPDVTMVGGRVRGKLPRIVKTCPGQLVIYSSDCQLVKNCKGFKGPGAGNNALLKAADAAGRAVAKRIKCPEDCSIKETSVIWKGWDCGNTPLSAVAAVEILIRCFNPCDEDDDGNVEP
jgi:hypothetical protein